MDLLPVGRNARCLRTPPTTEIGSTQPVVILSETKDLKARFFANEAQNDKIKNGCASRVEPSPGQERNPAYKGNISQNDEMKESGTRRAECPSLPAPRYCARVRHSAEANQASKTGGVRNKSGFRPTELNDRIAGKHGGLPLPWLLCLMLLSFIVSPVAAQVPTTRLLLNPTPLLIDTTISPSGVVNLEVADGVDIFAFDLIVQYDPSLLRVSQVTLGDFLGDGLVCMDQVNDPGLVHYNCTRFAMDMGVSGSGVLLTLTFEALGQGGDTPLSLAGSQLFESQNAFPVDLSLENGAVSVRPFSTYLPLILTANGQGMEAMP